MVGGNLFLNNYALLIFCPHGIMYKFKGELENRLLHIHFFFSYNFYIIHCNYDAVPVLWLAIQFTYLHIYMYNEQC